MVTIISNQSAIMNYSGNNKQIKNIKIWCEESSIHFKFVIEYPYENCCTFTFDNNIDLMAFKLRWV